MSFGRPPGFSTFSPTPPDRGSFPLDHEGECKTYVQEYMRCMKEYKNENGKCRGWSRKYLECRMEKGLMEKDDMTNLGFRDGQDQLKENPVKEQKVNADAVAFANSQASDRDSSEANPRFQQWQPQERI